MTRALPGLVCLCLLSAACGSASTTKGSASAGPTASSASAAATASQDPGVALVGRWQRTLRCQELVAALTAAGLAKSAPEAVAGAELVPGVVNDPTELADQAHPCKDAVPRVHSHFFTVEGSFGSLNHTGKQVDDDSYQVLGPNTLTIGAVTFRYTISGDDTTLRLQPVLPACADQGCFDAWWSVSVAYPGRTWQRVA